MTSGTLTVVDMHTGGEPVRIVTGGYPAIPRGTILEKRAWVRANLDHLRRLLIFEPRGHYDMYGALLVEPDLPGADLAVLFMHNEGYSTMCGHAVIALGRYAVDQGLVAAQEPVTTVGIECPCGLVVASVEVEHGRAGAVSFESVPAFLLAGNRSMSLDRYGGITFDMAYGGAFYALADCRQFGLAFGRDRVRDFVDAATALTERLKAEFPLSHPDHDDLAFLYGSILTDGEDAFSDQPTKKCLRLRRGRGRPFADRLRRHRAACRHACQGVHRHGANADFREHRRLALFRRCRPRDPGRTARRHRRPGRRPRLLLRQGGILARGRRRIGTRFSGQVSRLAHVKMPRTFHRTVSVA